MARARQAVKQRRPAATDATCAQFATTGMPGFNLNDIVIRPTVQA